MVASKLELSVEEQEAIELLAVFRGLQLCSTMGLDSYVLIFSPNLKRHILDFAGSQKLPIEERYLKKCHPIVAKPFYNLSAMTEETEATPNTEPNMQSNPETNPHHPANPFFIQPGEGASSPLVPDLLTTENYVTWARTMRRALNIKNKLGFIDGKIAKPTNVSDPLPAPWERCNDMVIAWRQHSERFSIQNAPRIFQLTKSISSLTQDTDSVSQYYNKLKSFWDELEIYEPMPLCTCGSVKILQEYTHRSKVMQFLMGLDDSFDSVRAQILLHDPLPALNQVQSLFQQEERRRQIHSMPAPLTMVTRGLDSRSQNNSRKDRLFCSHCNIPGHSLECCFKVNPHLPMCSHCHIPGHIKEKCYKLNGFPPGHKHGLKLKSFANQSSLVQEEIHHRSSITQEQYKQLLALLNPSHVDATTPTTNNAHVDSSPVSTHTHGNASNTSWIIDAGATDHMICSLNLFTNNVTTVSNMIKLPNGSTTTATHLIFGVLTQLKDTMVPNTFLPL
ncbi:uncharacterized protein LOC122291017 [Carya illinoinensis]|uniref:uncharacterized protein LOC122291017 n=1 Tax=Carya illinoinensis TaxID=32201 RepID=UPI001C728FA2|nr:uncharacterized protein LOC122291017 [Carya illinoinensis]